jgi:hypothetical protein
VRRQGWRAAATGDWPSGVGRLVARASFSPGRRATLWLIGENLVQDIPVNALLSTDMGVSLQTTNQGHGTNPEVRTNDVAVTVQFTNGSVTFGVNEKYDLGGGCPAAADYDALDGSGVITHRYATPGLPTPGSGNGAVVMRSTGTTPQGVGYNTIMMSHPWFDLYPKARNARTPGYDLAKRILRAALPQGCWPGDEVTDVAEEVEDDTLPRVTRLHPSSPNPFNPATTIGFDLARASAVELRVYNVSGRLVRTLVDEKLDRKRHAVVWNGLDDRERRVASGIYFVRLVAGDARQVRKVVVLR